MKCKPSDHSSKIQFLLGMLPVTAVNLGSLFCGRGSREEKNELLDEIFAWLSAQKAVFPLAVSVSH